MATRGVSTDVNGSFRPCCRYSQPNEQEEYPMPWSELSQKYYFTTNADHESTTGSFNDLYNSKEIIKLRKALGDGIRVPECKQCWVNEDASNMSYREVMNNRFKDITIDVDQLVSDPPVYVDLKLSNVCNLMCRMCSTVASSKILKEERRVIAGTNIQLTTERYWSENKIIGTYNENDFIDWLPHIREINFTGGDPLVGKENREVLQLIIDNGYASEINIHLNTNGMLMSKLYIEILKQFKQVDIAFSIDDIGDRLYYHRHGAEYSKFLKHWNMITELAPDIKKHIYMTICNYNIWDIAEAYTELSKLTNNISYEFVYNPKEQNISYLHPAIKAEIIKKYEGKGYVWNKMMKFINIDHGKDLTLEFHKDIKKFDARRSEDFKTIYPEWSEIIMYV